MGKPSDKIRSARRPGRRERARVKRLRRATLYRPGAGGGHVPVKLGRKKLQRELQLSIMTVKHNSEPAEGQQTASL